ncbi:uncharacterized protein EI90DRAFT_3021010 [Cantharellus anzutake]|uniref:uncharacterized protein n=1 Tax=Cantharellus anzutake TaxID=1750568 RepID=UPI001908D41D|nr:uncharacterized protein EI90DRAFT_3021010 [Cantharellus anzutake]KAF8318555.1 hypothetical protein EI90DRAFT_3021010 [Cantharellus anzutake]
MWPSPRLGRVVLGGFLFRQFPPVPGADGGLGLGNARVGPSGTGKLGIDLREATLANSTERLFCGFDDAGKSNDELHFAWNSGSIRTGNTVPLQHDNQDQVRGGPDSSDTHMIGTALMHETPFYHSQTEWTLFIRVLSNPLTHWRS